MLSISPIIAHRGASAYAPENTVPAFKKAASLGAGWVEFDVVLTADQVPVVLHDTTLGRTNNGKGVVRNHTWEQLQQLDAGHWFSEAYLNTPIPSLACVLTTCAALNLGINIELKPTPGQSTALVTQTLATVAKHWPEQHPAPLYSSFDSTCLATLRQESKTAIIGLLLDHWKPQWQALAKTYQCSTIHLNQRVLTPKRVQLITQAGYPVLAYTVNNPIRAKQLFHFGVTAVFSDYPDLLLA